MNDPNPATHTTEGTHDDTPTTIELDVMGMDGRDDEDPLALARRELASVLARHNVKGEGATSELADRVSTLWAAGERGELEGADAELWSWVASEQGEAGLVALLERGGERARTSALVLRGCAFLRDNAFTLKRFVREKPDHIVKVAGILREKTRDDLEEGRLALLKELNTLEPVLKTFANKKAIFGRNRPRWWAIDLNDEMMPVLSGLRAIDRARASADRAPERTDGPSAGLGDGVPDGDGPDGGGSAPAGEASTASA